MTESSAAHMIRATCWRIVDCGNQTWWFEDRPRAVRELRIGFELLDEVSRNGDRRTLDARYALAFSARSHLKRDLEGWLARPLTPAERKGAFDFAALLSRSCRLSIKAITGVADCYRAIAGIAPPAGPDYPANRPPLFLSLAKGAFDPEVFHRLPPWMRDRILASPTFHALERFETAWPAEHVRPATLAEQLGDEIPW